MTKNIHIRAKLTGIDIQTLRLRRKLDTGSLTDQIELVAVIPAFGSLPLDDDMQLDIRDMSLPPAERIWKTVTAKELREALQRGEYRKL